MLLVCCGKEDKQKKGKELETATETGEKASTEVNDPKAKAIIVQIEKSIKALNAPAPKKEKKGWWRRCFGKKGKQEEKNKDKENKTVEAVEVALGTGADLRA